ncbi:biliverdin-producing heme oxygenase [Canibacter zhoujuaniae]|uniref:biliverdin-producing heme oxygenase n=1 Tax=Canibacter zhoujuaniae TaxID=2708343 RepID=UPI00141FA2AC|nr:biliverdin-producing heme oxygenase [Canibacter zhoujuaniae]
MTAFSQEVIQAVLTHMNDDHNDDCLLIARAFGYPDATEAKMVGLDTNSGTWRVVNPAGEHQLRVEWPCGVISERAEIRREIVALYEEACKKTGTAPRGSETASSENPHAGGYSAPHGHHGGGNHGGAHHGHPGKKQPAPLPDDAPFSAVVRHRSWGFHSDSEGASFMADIMRGQAPLQDYIDLVAQHYYMYAALEEVTTLLAQEDATRPFISEELLRMSALEADLEHLIGDDWREKIAPVPAVTEYTNRIRKCGAEGYLPGIVAHHYTRYLGDLSGGQMIARRMRKQHGFEHAGVEFYEFNSIPDLDAFKNEYRANLDALGETLDAAGHERFLDEVRMAYEFNTAVFNDLAAVKAEAVTRATRRHATL